MVGAIGVKGEHLQRAEMLISAGCNIICVDVAHGDHILVKKTIEELNKFRNRGNFILVAGNVATGEGFNRLTKWGADAIRVGIGGRRFMFDKNKYWNWCI